MLKMCAYTSDSGLVAARFHPLVNNIVVQARNATCQATLPQSRWTLPHASLARQSGRQMQRAYTPTSRTSFVLSSLSLGGTFGFTRVPNQDLSMDGDLVGCLFLVHVYCCDPHLRYGPGYGGVMV